MNAQAKPRGHAGRTVLLIVLALLVLLCAAPFVMNALSWFAYDDIGALTAANAQPVALSADPDGEHLIFRMDKADVYSLLLDGDFPASLNRELDGKVNIQKLGYSLSPGQANIRAAAKVLGFLPVQLQAGADIAVSAQELRLQPTEVQLGPWIRIGAERLADWIGVAELRDGFSISLTEYTEPLRADRVWIEDDGIALSSCLPGQVLDEVAAQNELIPRLMRLYYGDDSAAAQALSGSGRADFIRAAGESLDALRGTLRDVCAFGSDAYRCALATDLSGLPFDLSSGLDAYPQLREAQFVRVAEAQERYRTAQTDLRHDYWYKNVTLSAAHLLDTDGEPLEERLPVEWEARIVLQYNANYDAIVKTNEGNPRLQVPIPGLPMMSELPRDSRNALPPEGDGPFDLTLALRLPSGIPAVVFLTAEDEYGLAVISEAQFAEFRESPRIPIRCSADIAAGERADWLRLTGTDVVGNYINVP